MELAHQLFLEATQDDEVWPQALGEFARTCNADHAFVHLVTGSEATTFGSPETEEMVDEFRRDEWGLRNPRMRRGLELARKRSGELMTDWRLFQPEEIAAEPFEQEFARKFDVLHYVGTFVPVSEGSFLVLTLERGHRKGFYVNRDLAVASRALRLLSASLSGVLRPKAAPPRRPARVAEAFALIDGAGRLISTSPRFDALVGRFVLVRAGFVHALDPSCDPPLQAMIAEAAIGMHDGKPVRLRSPGGRKATALASPMTSADEGREAADAQVLLSIDTQGEPPTLSSLLKKRFGLTDAETRLALRIGHGEELRQAASHEGITFETARTRLKSVFVKTGVSRQLELVLLVQGLGAGR